MTDYETHAPGRDGMSEPTREQEAGRLCALLAAIEANDLKHGPRYRLVIEALATALRAGLSAGIRIDPKEPDWPVVCIELPTGQVSWHVAEHLHPWDGHSRAEKYLRCREFIEQTLPPLPDLTPTEETL